MATATNTLDGMFDRKTTAVIERSLRAHRGALTKLTCYREMAANAATIMPTEKRCRALEQLKEKMYMKMEEMEAGYDALIELEPDDKKWLQEKNRR